PQAELVAVRADARRSALEVARQPALELLDARLAAGVLEGHVRQAELLGALREARRQFRERGAAGILELDAEARDLRRPRRECLAVAHAEPDAPEGRVALPERGAVAHRQLRSSREEARKNPVEVGASRGRARLDDCEAVRREDERCDLSAELLRRAERRPVELRD